MARRCRVAWLGEDRTAFMQIQSVSGLPPDVALERPSADNCCRELGG